MPDRVDRLHDRREIDVAVAQHVVPPNLSRGVGNMHDIEPRRRGLEPGHRILARVVAVGHVVADAHRGTVQAPHHVDQFPDLRERADGDVLERERHAAVLGRFFQTPQRLVQPVHVAAPRRGQQRIEAAGHDDHVGRPKLPGKLDQLQEQSDRIGPHFRKGAAQVLVEAGMVERANAHSQVVEPREKFPALNFAELIRPQMSGHGHELEFVEAHGREVLNAVERRLRPHVREAVYAVGKSSHNINSSTTLWHTGMRKSWRTPSTRSTT